MKTDDLISMLATGVTPVDPAIVARRLSRGLVVGVLGALVLMLLIYGPRPDLHSAMGTAIFWYKLAFPLTLAFPAAALLARLARPGMGAGAPGLLLPLPPLAVWAAALLILIDSPADQRLALILGHTWRSCPFNIALLSIPGFIALLVALRGLAPTRPRAAGAAAGLLSACAGTVIYCFHCPEMAPPFWAVWYLLGLLLPTAAGALLGPRVLRW